jgi:threonine/homoserine/homoserine lactone efflux protein
LSLAWLVSLVGFAFVTSITPGPNNLMLTTSGANFGLRRTLPHIAGVTAGFALMVAVTGFGFGAVLAETGAVQAALKWVGAAYMAWLAWQVARAGAVSGSGASSGRPLTLLEAGLFQWVNPKGWTMVVALAATYFDPSGPTAAQVLTAALVFFACGVVSSFIWTTFGTVIGRFLSTPARARAFNWSMAGLIIVSLIPILLPHS